MASAIVQCFPINSIQFIVENPRNSDSKHHLSSAAQQQHTRGEEEFKNIITWPDAILRGHNRWYRIVSRWSVAKEMLKIRYS